MVVNRYDVFAGRDASMSEPTSKSYSLSLGRGDRSITDQGEEVETVDPYIVAHPGARRSVNFLSCKLRGYIEIDGEKVYEPSVNVYVQERLPDQPPWSEPWKIGALNWQYASLSLCVSPVAFQQFWEMADARENERLDLDISGQVSPSGGLFVFENRLKVVQSSRSTERPDELRALREIAAYIVILLGYISIGLAYWQGGFSAAVVAAVVLWPVAYEVLDLAYPGRAPARLERQARRRKASEQRASKRAALRREGWIGRHPAFAPFWSLLQVVVIVGGLIIGVALAFPWGTMVVDRYGAAILAAAHDPKPLLDMIVWWQWIVIYFVGWIGWFAAKVQWEVWGTPTDED